jgi:tRNA pseudouridine55 synthase
MESIDGVINLNKPIGITSAKALYKLRAITRLRKSGHTGTLDPGAAGVLVIGVGKGTKLAERVMDQPKIYRATARLDITSESFDSDRPTRPVEVATIPDAGAVRRALASFEGEIEQAPPAISALKIGGVPAYKLARGEESPKMKPRPVVIYWLHLHAYEWPSLDFEMACGRGTYVRSVIRDFGERLGTGGCLTRLTRKAVGPFHIDDAWDFERLTTHSPDEYILPLTHPAVLGLNNRAVSPPPRP